MKWIAPDYYEEFACIADRCRHSCCVGWEIDIDEESAAYYRSLPGEIGEKLRASIEESGQGACFRLTEEERCPFLTGEGLCELILTLGEGALCQICEDHPRFRHFFSNRTEIGLGLCCEAAGRLILGREQPVGLVVLQDDGQAAEADACDGCEDAYAQDEEIQEEIQEKILSLRERLMRVAQDRSISIRQRVDRMAEAAGIAPRSIDYAQWAEFLGTLERLDERWAQELARLAQSTEEPVGAQWERALEQLLVYLLYRHLPGALEDGDVRGRVGFVYVVWCLLERMLGASQEADMQTLVELARLYSSEIEYSDENVGAILAQVHDVLL